MERMFYHRRSCKWKKWLSYCFRNHESSRARQDNYKLLERLHAFISRIDDEKNRQIHAILDESISNLIVLLESHGEQLPISQPLRTGNAYDLGFSKQLDKNPTSPVKFESAPITPQPQGTTKPSLSSSSPLTPCPLSSSQWELIMRLESIHQWSTLLQSSRLLDELDPPLPSLNHCSSTASGYIRIGSWNLNRFGISKAKHPGFLEVVCLTILRTNYSLLLLQEIANVEVADLLCAELNNPTLPHVKQWIAQHPPALTLNWKAATSLQPTGSMFQSKEYAIFLYNASSGIQITKTGLLCMNSASSSGKVKDKRKFFARSPCTCWCQIRNSHFVIASVHLKAPGLRNSKIGQTLSEIESLGVMVQAFYETQPAGTKLIISGDFNLNPDHEAYDCLRKHGLWPVLISTQSTTSTHSEKPSSPTSKSVKTRAYDNAWLSADLVMDNASNASVHHSGQSGVITQGIRHPLIPSENGAGANGFVSDHIPLWFDLLIP